VTIALIDYGAGNVPSVERALQRLGAESLRVTQASQLECAKAIILPGVGHCATMIRALDERQLRAGLLDAISRGIAVLGICLGLQALFDSSEEAPSLRGLGVLPGSVQSLPRTVKLPHMGWNRLNIQHSSRLLEGLGETDFFYFAHTYAAPIVSDAVVATCEHGATFAAVIELDNLFAAQFHPEKSGAAGARFLENFIRLVA
jgi:imidazole glycerol phosphate synthase glutamine amidotransferase subunit